MFLALAALLIQPAIIPQTSFVAENIAVVQPADAVSSAPVAVEDALPTAPVPADAFAQPGTSLSASTSDPAPAGTPAIVLSKPAKNMTVSVGELLAEGRRNQRIWMALGIASHSAATFDAWSTRRAITSAGAQEMNPLLKPFAGNASLYAAIQVAPAVMDYVGKKMMYNRHSWVRHMWWVPQSASTVSSLFCGAHNLGVHAPAN